MEITMRFRWAWSSICLCIGFLAVAVAQQQSILPTNETSAAASPSFILRTMQMESAVRFAPIVPLTKAAGLSDPPTQLQAINITGTLVLTSPSNANSLKPSDIAYISCDLSAYANSNIDAAGTVDLAASSGHAVAVLLYSKGQSHCYLPNGGFEMVPLYTMTNATASMLWLNGLQTNPPSQGPTQIKLDPSSQPQNGNGNGNGNGNAFGASGSSDGSNNNSSSSSSSNNSNNNNTTNTNTNNVLGPSPTTAVAMIILYSITGIITALFLIIIVTGAVRAHRHPERYGPRNVLGRPRQSRARGIARAMLDTIPIVKFGEREPDKTAEDVELGASGTALEEGGDGQLEPNGERRGVANVPAVEDANTLSPPDVVRTATAPAAPPTQDANTQLDSDNGLTCSVCTDDFIKGQDLRVLPCNHRFHPECIDPWLLNVSGTCPLCRVDLRPTSSNEDDPTAREDDAVSPQITDFSSENPAFHTAEETPGTRRRRNGLSLYFQHTLNIRRMRDATPEERIAALRRLRTVNRASHPRGSSGEEPPNGESSRGSRLSMRVREALRIHRRSQVEPSLEEVTPAGRAENQSARDETAGETRARTPTG